MDAVLKQIESKKKEMIKLLSEVVALDTSNPPGNEYKVARIVEREFKKAGIKYKRFEKVKGRPSIVGYIGKGKPCLLIAAHSDTVPAGEGWITDPFKLVKKGTRLYGLGACDNKGPLACLIVLAKVMKKHEDKLKGQLMIGIVADEEKGSVNGMEYLIKTNKLKPAYAIIPDIGQHMEQIDVAEKGILRIHITSIGKQAHGSRPYLGINAIYNMMDFLQRLKHYQLKYKKHKLLSKPTINVGLINGGSAPNSVPAMCDVILDIRYLPLQKRNEIIKEINGLLEKVKKKNKTAKFIMKIGEHIIPTEVPSKNILVEMIQKHSKGILKKKPKPSGLSGATVVKQLLAKKILAVGFGPGGPAHCSDEYISIKELVNFAKICSLVALDLIGKKHKQ